MLKVTLLVLALVALTFANDTDGSTDVEFHGLSWEEVKALKYSDLPCELCVLKKLSMKQFLWLLRGKRGPCGPKGCQGKVGPKGDKGCKGDKGNAGPKGDKGDCGPQGCRGPRGKSITGPCGHRGHKGPKGKDAVCVSKCSLFKHVNKKKYILHHSKGEKHHMLHDKYYHKKKPVATTA
jgi:hypothetical protein